VSVPSQIKAGDKQSALGSNGRSFNDGSRDGARDRRSGTGSGSDSFGEADRRAGYTPPYEEELDRYAPTFNNKSILIKANGDFKHKHVEHFHLAVVYGVKCGRKSCSSGCQMMISRALFL
jgi:hypothetical protein